MTPRTVTWALVAAAVGGALAYVTQGDVFCGDLPQGCPDDTWHLMAEEARAGIIAALVSSLMAAVSLLHPDHRGARLGLALLTLGMAGAAVVNVLADHGDLPGPPLGACDDTRDGTSPTSTKCAGWDPHWTAVFALPGLAMFTGAGILVGKGLRWAVSRRAASTPDPKPDEHPK